MTVEDWTKPEVTEDNVGGERRARVIYRTRGSAKSPNTLKLEAATHLLNIQTGTVGFGFFTQSRMEPVSVTSDQPVLTVKPLPAGAPAGAYDGGRFHRTVKPVNQPDNAIRIGVIQGAARKGAAEYAPIPLERTAKTGIPHLNGVISMARMEPDSAARSSRRSSAA